jgi:glutaredoxin
MRKLVLIIAIGVGVWFWDKGELPFMSAAGAYDEGGNPVVWIFTVMNCGAPCQQGLDGLDRRRVEYEEKQIDLNNDADENVKLWKTLRKDNSFPLIVAGKEKIIGSSRPALAGILGINFGDQYLSRTEKRYFKEHFYADGSPGIVMYGADWCPYCKKLREEFDANDVDFIEIDVEKSGEMQTMAETMEIYGYPATWVGYSRVNGSNLKAVNAVLRSY